MAYSENCCLKNPSFITVLSGTGLVVIAIMQLLKFFLVVIFLIPSDMNGPVLSTIFNDVSIGGVCPAIVYGIHGVL